MNNSLLQLYSVHAVSLVHVGTNEQEFLRRPRIFAVVRTDPARKLLLANSKASFSDYGRRKEDRKYRFFS